MKKILNKIALTILLLLISTVVYSQPFFKIASDAVDSSGYPTIKMEFKAYDKSGNRIPSANIKSADIKLLDNGISRTFTMNCPANESRFSIILCLDVTGSMNDVPDPNNPNSPTKFEILKASAINFIKNLPVGRSECCITNFNTVSMLKHDFKKIVNAASKQSLIDSINKINVGGATDFNSAFLWDKSKKFNYDALKRPTGACYVALRSAYKPIIAFLTDGLHDDNYGPFDASGVINFSVANKITIFTQALGLDLDPTLTSLAQGTGGTAFGRSVDQNSIDAQYQAILASADALAEPAPCTIQWTADCSCGNIDLSLALGADTAKANVKYKIPANLKPYFEANPRDYTFLNVNPGNSGDIDIVLTARNNFIDITGYSSSNPNYTIIDPVPLPTKLLKDQTLKIKVHYNSKDSLSSMPDFKILGSACDSSFILPNAGFIFAKDVDMGTSGLSAPTKNVKVIAFCNHTKKAITVKSTTIKGNNENDFSIVAGNLNNVIIPPDSCVEFTFGFKPGDVGKRSSIFIVETDRGTSTSSIFGEGTGKPNITALNAVAFTNTNCTVTSRDSLITLSNAGGVDLVITKMQITPATDFSFKGGNPVPPNMTIPPGGKQDITITFNPASVGLKNAVLAITSNADNSPNFNMNLSGTKDDIQYTTSVQNIDLKFVCPSEKKDTSFTITNTSSNGNISLTGTLKGANFTLTGNAWTINQNGNQIVSLSFNSLNEGFFYDTLKVAETSCNILKTVFLRAEVLKPKSQTGVVIIQSSVNVPKDTTIVVYNKTNRDMWNVSFSFGDGQFTILSPVGPVNIPANDSVKVKIHYLPTTDKIVNTYIYTSGEPCSFKDSVVVTSNPLLATAEIKVDNYSAMVGEKIVVPVRIINKVKFKESATTAINATFGYDNTLLKPIAPTPVGNPILINNAVSNAQNTDEIIINLNFEVLGGSAATSTSITVLGTQSIGGVVVFKQTAGLFSLKSATAKIGLKDVSAKPGEVFTLPIYFTNVSNVSLFHDAILTSLRFNATLMEPVDPTPLGTVVNGERTINITDLPINTSSTEVVLREYKFRAILGNAETTDIFIENSSSKIGKITFTEQKSAVLTLNGLCKSGGTRLFDPNGKTYILAINPNPASSDIIVNYSIGEIGTSRLWVTDMLGTKIVELTNKDLELGNYESKIDVSNLNSGTYFIILQSPTQLISKRLDIVK